MSGFEHVRFDKSAGVATITFDRPDKKNALTSQMYSDVVTAMHDAEADTAVRVILLTGAGAAFTAGNDLLDFMNNPPQNEDAPVFRFLLALLDAHKPIVAAVNGVAVGIGLTMLLHCDLVYVADTAKLQAPFVPLGLSPEGGSSLLLPRMMGHAKAAEILYFGEPMSAGMAVDVGIANSVVPAADLLAYARARCETLAKKAPGSVRLAKRLLKGPRRDELMRVMQAEAVFFMERLGSDEAREAFTAFFEKREPDFSRVG